MTIYVHLLLRKVQDIWVWIPWWMENAGLVRVLLRWRESHDPTTIVREELDDICAGSDSTTNSATDVIDTIDRFSTLREADTTGTVFRSQFVCARAG